MIGCCCWTTSMQIQKVTPNHASRPCVRTSAPAAEDLDVLFDEKINLWTETWSYELILKVSIVYDKCGLYFVQNAVRFYLTGIRQRLGRFRIYVCSFQAFAGWLSNKINFRSLALRIHLLGKIISIECYTCVEKRSSKIF